MKKSRFIESQIVLRFPGAVGALLILCFRIRTATATAFAFLHDLHDSRFTESRFFIEPPLDLAPDLLEKVVNGLRSPAKTTKRRVETMKGTRFTEEQISYALRQVESGLRPATCAGSSTAA